MFLSILVTCYIPFNTKYRDIISCILGKNAIEHRGFVFSIEVLSNAKKWCITDEWIFDKSGLTLFYNL
jgi:hypothetical protein